MKNRIDYYVCRHVFWPFVLFASLFILTVPTAAIASDAESVRSAKWQLDNPAPDLSFGETIQWDWKLLVVPAQYAENKSNEKRLVYCTSVESALEKFREIRTENPDAHISIAISVEFLKSQPLVSPIILGKEFSGTPDKPTLFAGATLDNKPGQAVFSGAISLVSDRAKWLKWNDAKKSNAFKERLNKTFDLRIRPEIADVLWVCDLKPLAIKDYGDATTLGKRPELFAKGVRQPLARGPNEGFIRTGKALGQTSIETGWAGNGTKEGIFEFVGDTTQLESWKNEPDLRLHGYWFWDWSEDYGKIESIDTAKKTITMQKPYHGYGYHDELRYYAANALCELDAVGEWYLDRDSDTLFWIPPKTIDTKNFDGVTLSCFDAPFMLEIHDAENIIVQNFGFEQGRNSAICVKNSTDCVLSHLDVKNMGKNGIEIQGGQHVGVSHCKLSQLGAGGMIISGGDRKTLSPGNHFVQDCVVQGFSKLKPTYTPAVLLSGCGHRIANNHFLDSGSSAMRLEGNDLLIEYNKIENVVNESDDQGGIDMWYNPSYRGVMIRFNSWKNITGGTKCGAAGIRLDDIICDCRIYGNLFENCGAVLFGAVQIHGGKDNVVENNVMLDCFLAVSFSPWGEKRYLEALDGDFVKNKIEKEVDIRSDIYQRKYPNLATIRENANVNAIVRNLIVNVKSEKPWRSDGGIQKMEGNVELKIPGVTMIQLSSPKFLEKHGLKQIPVENIGPRKIKR